MNRKNRKNNINSIKSVVISTLLSLALSAALLLGASTLAFRASDPDAVALPLGISTLVVSFALCGVVSGFVCSDKGNVSLSCLCFAASLVTLSLIFGDSNAILSPVARVCIVMTSSGLAILVGLPILNSRSSRGYSKKYYKSRR